MYFRSLFIALFITATFLLLLGWAVLAGHLPQQLFWFYLVVSVIAVLVYGWDKFAALCKWRRTPENVLHMYALLGGWPGALFAQQLFRHKSSKKTFRRGFWLTVALNLCLLGFVLSPQGVPVQAWLRSLTLPL